MTRPQTKEQRQYHEGRKTNQEARRDELARLRVENPEADTAWLAENLNVNIRTVQKDIKALDAGQPADELQTTDDKLQQFMERMEAKYTAQLEQVEAKYEAKLQELEAEKERLAVDKDELERQAAERADAQIADLETHFKKIMEESGREIVISDRDEDITWQGFTCHIPGNTPTEVYGIFAGVLKEAQRARNEAARISNFYKVR